MSESADALRARADVLGKSIESATAGMELPGVLGEWMVVGCNAFFEKDGTPNARYFIILSGGSMFEHHALGLLEKASEILGAGDGEG